MSKMPNRVPDRERNNRLRKRWNRHDVTVAVCAVMGIIVVSIASVLVVRALLTDFTLERQNEFATMTYTNIEISEPGGDYTVSFNVTDEAYVNNDHNGYVTKEAAIKNESGADKKPVYVRIKVITTIYDKDGYNISLLYPDVYADWNDFRNITPGSSSDEWTVRSDGYAYLNRILLPGESSASLFKSGGEANKVKIFNAAKLPKNSTVHIDILADAIQAVSTDTVKWKAADYYSPEYLGEVTTAWNVTPTLQTITDDQKEQQISVNCSWS